MPYSQTTYKDALINVATEGESQPYGKTNMSDIVKYWFLAKENNYCDVSKPALFDFKDLNGSCPCLDGLTGYNKVMREMIFEELKKEWKRRYKD